MQNQTPSSQTTNELSSNHPARKNTTGRSLLFFLAVVIAATSGWLWWENQQISAEISQLQGSINRIENQLQKDAGGQTLKSLAENEKMIVAAENYRTQWSTVMKSVLQYETQSVQFSNFSVNTDGKITATANATSVQNVQSLLRTLQRDQSTSEVFIPNITTESREDRFPVSFQLSFRLAL